MIYDIHTYNQEDELSASPTEVHVGEDLEKVLVIRLGEIKECGQITGREDTGRTLGVNTFRHTTKPVQARHIKLFNGATGTPVASGYVMINTEYRRAS